MNRKLGLLVIIGLSALLIAPAWKLPQDRRDIQAVLVKVVRDVTKQTATTGWQQALPLDVLKSGHRIRTDEKSIALIRFSDETKLVVREKTIVEIKGEVQGRQILDRNVHTTRGNIGFDVKKQERESFRFSSPISVASIRGTVGSFESIEQNRDILVIQSGLATLLNLISNNSQDVGSKQTGIASIDGSIDVRDSTPQELETANAEITPDDEGGQQQGQATNRVEVRGRDGRKIVITW